MVGHETLLKRLEISFGITGSALQWMRSYLSNRSQCVSIHNTQSDPKMLDFGMPQGSLIGPFGYPKYSAPVANIAVHHEVAFHQYADDTQLYVTCHHAKVKDALSHLEGCVKDIRSWSTSNKLKLNEDKTEFMYITSKHSNQKSNINSIHIGEASVATVSKARNIGVIFYSHLTLECHISTICKGAYYHLRAIAKIRKHLTMEATECLVNALITSRLDNCNSLLLNLPKTQTDKLQRIQNNAAKVVLTTKGQI